MCRQHFDEVFLVSVLFTTLTLITALTFPLNVKTLERPKDAETDYQCIIIWETPILAENESIIQYTVYYTLFRHPKTSYYNRHPLSTGILVNVTSDIASGELSTQYTLNESAVKPYSTYDITVTVNLADGTEGPPNDPPVTCTTTSVVDAPEPMFNEVYTEDGSAEGYDPAHDSFWVFLNEPISRQINGEINCYEVIVVPIIDIDPYWYKVKQTASPDIDYPDDKVQQVTKGDSFPDTAYTAYMTLGDELPGQLNIGRGEETTTCGTGTTAPARRKRDSSYPGSPKSSAYNMPVKPDHYYVIFLRAFVQNVAGEWTYSSSECSDYIKTVAEPDLAAAPTNIRVLLIGVICGALALFLVTILWCDWKRGKRILRPFNNATSANNHNQYNRVITVHNNS